MGKAGSYIKDQIIVMQKMHYNMQCLCKITHKYSAHTNVVW